MIRGRYGGLCAEHRAELAAKIKAEHHNGAAATKRAATESSARGSLEHQARGLVDVSKKLDRAARERKEATAHLRAIVEQFNAGLRELNEAAKALLQP